MRAYLRLDPEVADKKVGYPDGAFRAFIECITLAEQQPQRGRFRNEKLLRVLLDKRARWVPYLVQHGDLVYQPDGRIYLDGWDEWQEGDWKVYERVARIRNRKRGGVTPPTVTGDTPGTVITPQSGGGKPLPAVSGGRGGAPYNGDADGSKTPDDQVAANRAILEDHNASEPAKRAAMKWLMKHGIEAA